MRRIFWLAIPLTTLILTMLALNLTPHPSGFGTHQGLGLPPCPFLSIVKIPCPSCGLTTSWVHLLHGNFIQACRVHWLGPLFYTVLLILSLMSFPLALGKKPIFYLKFTAWFQKNSQKILYGFLTIYFSVWIFQVMLKIKA